MLFRLTAIDGQCGSKPILDRTDELRVLEAARTVSNLAWDVSADADRLSVVDKRVWSALHVSGLAMAPFPKQFGGADLCEPGQHEQLLHILRQLGAADLCIGRLFEGHVNAIILLWQYGSAEQLQALAGRVESGGFSAVWGAEDANGLRIVDSEPKTLAGRKILASGAGFVTDPVVTASAGDQQFIVLLSLSSRQAVDLSGWTAQGMRSTATGSVDFSGTAIADENIVGKPGDFLRQPYFSGGAWRFCAVQLGGLERLVDLFRGDLVTRRRSEDPYQLERLAHCISSAKTASHWVREAARRLSQDDTDPARTVAIANLTRGVTARCARDVMATVQSGVGLRSFVQPHPIERISRDLATYLCQPAPDLAMSDAAKAYLSSECFIGDF